MLDDNFKSSGIEVGDTIEDSASKIKLKVVGFTQDAMYGHIAAAYLSTDTYRTIWKTANYRKWADSRHHDGRHIKNSGCFAKNFSGASFFVFGRSAQNCGRIISKITKREEIPHVY